MAKKEKAKKPEAPEAEKPAAEGEEGAPKKKMAGKTLVFDIEVTEVREASDEEKAHGHVHGPGGHHH